MLLCTPGHHILHGYRSRENATGVAGTGPPSLNNQCLPAEGNTAGNLHCLLSCTAPT
jgi:hypothetical protein